MSFHGFRFSEMNDEPLELVEEVTPLQAEESNYQMHVQALQFYIDNLNQLPNQ
jgi:hypothetical protein